MFILNNFFLKKKKKIFIGIICSQFNYIISNKLLSLFIKKIIKFKIKKKNIICYKVPGVLEIPLTLKKIIKNKNPKLDIIILIGIVIKGKTYHFNLILNQLNNNIGKLSLKFNIPIINSILIAKNRKQIIKRLKIHSSYITHTIFDIINLYNII